MVADAVGEPEHPGAAGRHRRLHQDLPQATQRYAGHVGWKSSGGQHEGVQGLAAAVRIRKGGGVVNGDRMEGEGGNNMKFRDSLLRENQGGGV